MQTTVLYLFISQKSLSFYTIESNAHIFPSTVLLNHLDRILRQLRNDYEN